MSRGCRGRADSRLQGVCGGGPPALLAERSLGSGRRRLASGSRPLGLQLSQGRGRSLLVRRAHGRLAGLLLRVTGRATPLPEDAFSPTRAAAQVSPSPFFLRVLAREEMAWQAGTG